MKQYLETSPYIDWKNKEILNLAGYLSRHSSSKENIARRSFEWVRDEVMHSADFGLDPVTIKASEVLKYSTGYCFAKSHLLAALLRANNIPTGLCYQRLSIHGAGAPFTLHGFNSIFLENYGWYRVDPRGNKKGVDAQFSPPKEKLAFSVDSDGEVDFPNCMAKPLPLVISTLKAHRTFITLNENLPDAETIELNESA